MSTTAPNSVHNDGMKHGWGAIDVRRHVRRGVLSAGFVFALLELVALMARLPYMEPGPFERNAPVVLALGDVRVGYDCWYHGCFPVWTYDDGGILSADPRDAQSARDWNPAIRRAIAGELRDIPRQLLIEATLGVALIAWFVAVVPWLSVRSRSVRAALAGMGAWALVIAPAVVIHYGVPMSTGTAAPTVLVVTSGSGFDLMAPGVLLYRVLLALAGAPPVLVGAALGLLDLEELRLVVVAVVALGFVSYGTFGALVGRFQRAGRSSKEMVALG